MTGRLTANELLDASAKAFDEFGRECRNIPDIVFFEQPGEKWSIAQQLQHLVTSTRSATLAFSLPSWLIRIIGGKPKKPSDSYDGLVDRYLKKLQAGGKASGRYIPKQIAPTTDKAALILQWEKVTAAYLRAIVKRRKKDKLDEYAVPHPLLGHITLRELAYFTIYHTGHHLQLIRNQAVLRSIAR